VPELPEIVSPCVSVCRIDPATGYCNGCFRTRDEIQAWGASDSSERLAVLARLRERRRAQGVANARDRRRSRRRPESLSPAADGRRI
jgi:predicted Fe-S protein YdhL (DUF1289 family)